MNFSRFSLRKISLFLAGLVLPVLPALAGPDDGKVDVYWIDVEGGGCTLIVTPAGESVLVDAGNPGERDPGRIVAMAKIAGITQIDNLVTTHYHVDHMGGTPRLSTLMPIHNVFDNSDKNPSREQASQEYRNFKADKRIMINPGDELPLKQKDGGLKLTIRCIAARKTFIDPPPGAKENPFAAESKAKEIDLSDNANSVVQLLSFGDFRFYDGGDVTWNVEKDMVTPLNRVGVVDLYQVTHHGLALSNNPVLVKALSPTVTVMNNGSTKGTEAETIATLKATPSIQANFQLHKNTRADGNVNNTSDEYIANLTTPDPANYIKMSVAADGKSYTVGIPATKFEKTFETKKKE